MTESATAPDHWGENPADNQIQPPFYRWGGNANELAGAVFAAVKFPGWEQFTRWEWLPEELKNMETNLLYIGVDGSKWHLAGNHRGREGAVLESELMGAMSVPFDHRFSEGPYLIGSRLERTDIKRRTQSFGVILNPNANVRARLNISTETIYRNTEARWQRAWSKTQHGWLGYFTRSTGWRWLKVILDGGATPETMKKDPVAFGNNMRQVTMNVVSPDPYAYKKMFRSKTVGFDATKPKVTVGGEGSLFTTLEDFLTDGIEALPTQAWLTHVQYVNKGQIDGWPKFIISGTGTAWIQDGLTQNLVRCPEIYSGDGFLMVDTDPTARTFTTSKEPVDNVFYRFARQAEILDYLPLLHDLGDQGLPAWRRTRGQRFASIIPREKEVTTAVYHTNPEAKVTAFMPQKYETAF